MYKLRLGTSLSLFREGFAEKLKEAKALGFSLITLGKRILRAETAAVALTSVVMFSLGELGAHCKKPCEQTNPIGGAL